MSQGIFVWVLGDSEKIELYGKLIQGILKEFFPCTIILTEKSVQEGLCEGESQNDDLKIIITQKMIWVGNLIEKGGGAAIALSSFSRRSERDSARKKASAFMEVLIRGKLPPELEAPYYPEIEIDENDGEEECKKKILQALQSMGIAGASESQYNESEEEIVKKRLEKLGYL